LRSPLFRCEDSRRTLGVTRYRAPDASSPGSTCEIRSCFRTVSGSWRSHRSIHNGADVTVKDTNRYADIGGWGYYNFNHHEPKAPTAKLRAKNECAFCHIASAKKDEVWTQFYRLLSCSLSRGGAQFFTPPPRIAPIVGAHSRRQDPKTPVEQALMRGLGTA
jgi:Cytochrome P460